MPPPLSSQLQGVTEAALADTAALWTLPPAELPDAMMDLAPGIVDTWRLAAASTGADWYDELRDKAGVAGRFSAIVELDDPGAEALAGWAAEPLNQPTPDLAAARERLEGGLQKRMANAANLTVTRSAAEDPHARGYMRRTKAGACKFCRMVASRGAVYTKTSARFACHEHCFCEAVPAWGGKALPVHKYRPSDRPMKPEDRARVKKWIADNLDDAEAKAAAQRVDRTPDRPASSGDKPAAGEPDAQLAKPAERVDPLELERRRQRDVAQWLDAEDEHRHAVDYYRRVDDEDLHSIPRDIVDEPAAVEPIKETPMDRAARELEDAIDAGDDVRIDAAAAELERLEDVERKAAARKVAAEERRAAKANAEADEIVALIEDGWDPAEAEAQITGKSVENIRRRDFMSQARADGHDGDGFDELVTSVHRLKVDELAIEAENATNGRMVRRKYELTVAAKQLWFVNDTTARKWMSEEMAAWFDENGRLTRSTLRKMVLSGEYNMARFAAREDYLQ